MQNQTKQAPKKLEVEGVQVEIAWGEFIIGSSFFVPCINAQAVMGHVIPSAASFGMKIKARARVENGMWGVRVWRVA